jgi:hypothetical protein
VANGAFKQINDCEKQKSHKEKGLLNKVCTLTQRVEMGAAVLKPPAYISRRGKSGSRIQHGEGSPSARHMGSSRHPKARDMSNTPQVGYGPG